MTDSSAYSSLFALVDSHLSKLSLENNEDGKDNNAIRVPPFNSMVPNGSVSESSLSLSKRLPPPPFNISNSSINNVLAGQLANMFKAKELKKKAEEKEKLEEQMRRLKIEEEEKSVIDLMQALKTPRTELPITRTEEPPSISSSCESLFNAKFNEWNDEPEKTKTSEPLLPCITDMSYLLKEKSKMSKGSSFGRVLSSRLRPVAAPYLRTKIPTNIIRFAFDTPSPCDILKEKLRRPTMSCSYTFNIHDFI